MPADPADAEDRDVMPDALDRGRRARLTRTTRTDLRLSQAGVATRVRVAVGTLRASGQARVTPPDVVMASVRVIGRHPDVVAEAVA